MSTGFLARFRAQQEAPVRKQAEKRSDQYGLRQILADHDARLTPDQWRASLGQASSYLSRSYPEEHIEAGKILGRAVLGILQDIMPRGETTIALYTMNSWADFDMITGVARGRVVVGDDARDTMTRFLEHTGLDPMAEIEDQNQEAMGRYYVCRQSFLSMVDLVQHMQGQNAAMTADPRPLQDVSPSA